MISKHLPTFVVVLATAASVQAMPHDRTQTTQKSKAQAAAQQNQGEGTRIFQQNCSRCHNTPEGFSPRISGTIIHHMRVRASLSKHDEEEMLRFLNP